MISGKSFSEQCKWVVDPRYPSRDFFRYVDASHGDWVFVNGDHLDDFITLIPPSTSRVSVPVRKLKRFVIIIHNTDRSFGQAEMDALRPHILHVYAINTIIQHPRLTTIPLGFVDRQLSFLETFQPTSSERVYEIYVNFTAGTNSPKRNACLEAIQNDHRVVVRTGLTVPEYYTDLCKSKFVLCPEGTGIDTHRVYEALFCGAIPVVLRNSLTPLYERLPVCLLNQWTDPLYVPQQIPWSVNVNAYI